MKKIMLLNVSEPEEKRMAIVEDGVLQEFAIERASKEQIKGNIYKGKVVRIEPAIQAAFVDYGSKKSGFLSLSELNFETIPKSKSGKSSKRHTHIQDLISIGQELLVQVSKEERDTKGSSLTTYISLPGKYLVLLPGKKGTGISRKIESESERKRLKTMASNLKLPEKTGIIVRTEGHNRRKAELVKDLNNLVKLWENIESMAEKISAPALIYQESNFVIRALRDNIDEQTSVIYIDDQNYYKEAREFAKIAMPDYLNRLRQYKDIKPLFNKYNLEEQIEKIFLDSVPLKSGGSIVLENTEAMVTIDVNSGKSITAKDIEETALNTNIEAAYEIARQVRLRDMGGLIVVDFIDMRESKNRQEVEKVFKAALKRDRAKSDVSRISRFGLIELSRQRIKPNITEGGIQSCPVCHGTGMVLSPEAMAVAVFRKIREAIANPKNKTVEVIMPPSAANYLLNAKRTKLDQFEKRSHVKISVSGDSNLSIPEYIINSHKKKISVGSFHRYEAGEIHNYHGNSSRSSRRRHNYDNRFSKSIPEGEEIYSRQLPSAEEQEHYDASILNTINKLTSILSRFIFKKSTSG